MLSAQVEKAELFALLRLALQGILGSYHKPDDSTQPGLYEVLDPKTDPPENWGKSGVECLVFPPPVSDSPFLGGATEIKGSWEIRLIQHDPKLPLDEIPKMLMAAGLPVHVESHFRADDENREMMNLSIYSHQVICPT
jgi:hypothetical protein